MFPLPPKPPELGCYCKHVYLVHLSLVRALGQLSPSTEEARKVVRSPRAGTFEPSSTAWGTQAACEPRGPDGQVQPAEPEAERTQHRRTPPGCGALT